MAKRLLVLRSLFRVPLVTRNFSAAKPVDELVTVSFDKGDDQKTNGVAIISFNTPSNLNALTVDMGNSFQRMIQQLKELDSNALRCVVLTGAGEFYGFFQYSFEVLTVTTLLVSQARPSVLEATFSFC